MPGIEKKLIIMGADIVSDVLIDYYYSKKGEGLTTVSVEDILSDAMKYKDLRKLEIAKVQARINAGGTD